MQPHERPRTRHGRVEEVPCTRGAAIDANLTLEASPTAHIRIELDGSIVYANGAAARLFGRPVAEVKGQRFHDQLTTAGGIVYETQFMPSLRLREKVDELFFEIAGRGGSRIPVLVSGVLEKNEDGARQTALLVLFAARQRRQYEQELLAKRRQFEQVAEIIDRSSDAIIRLSSQLIVESWNDGAKEIFGRVSKEAVGQTMGAFLPADVAENIAAQVRRPGLHADIAMETSVLRGNGTSIDVSMRLTPHIEPPGRVVGFSAVLRDITSRKIAERALLQASKLASVERLASSISHELNNPLAAVTNLLYLLQIGARDEETSTLVETAQSELARVSHIATHALRFHRQSTYKTEVYIQSLFQEVLSLYRGRLAGSQITATANVYDASTLVCYEGELKQVLVNLVSNAFDAMRHGCRLLLRSRAVARGSSGERAVRITIADNGAGLGSEACSHLFEPFFSTKGIGGAGLGLWISKDLVERNGGRICVRSRNKPDLHGTVVSMVFAQPTGG